LELCSPKVDEKDVALTLLQRAQRRGGEVVIGDKNYRGREFTTQVQKLNATILRPRRRDEPGSSPHLAPIRQRIESIFWTCKDSSPSNAMAHAPSKASENASSRGSAASPQQSHSTINSDSQAVPSSTTPHNHAESLI
jgi:hypothetical protein